MAIASKKGKMLRKGDSTGRRPRKTRKVASLENPVETKLLEIMGRFTQALSLVIVCHRSLAAQSSADVGDEEETLRQAIRLLKNVYNEIDLASMATTSPRSSSGARSRSAISGAP
jgi:hypothetical protein